jgi:hypothetical protein
VGLLSPDRPPELLAVLETDTRIVGLFIDLALRTGPSLEDIEMRHQAKIRRS